MDLVYCANIVKDHGFPDTNEATHLIKVKRKRKGDEVYMTDGEGTLYRGVVLDDHPKHVDIQILNRTIIPLPRPYYLHVLISPLKSRERFEWFMEKAVEIGIDEVTPLLTQHTEKNTVRMDRLRKIAVSALKQSNTVHLPVINEPLSIAKYVSDPLAHEISLIAHCHDLPEKQALSRVLVDFCGKKKRSIKLLIGPEGDFSRNEVELCLKNNSIPVTLSHQRLRTETAGLVAVTTVANVWSHFQTV